MFKKLILSYRAAIERDLNVVVVRMVFDRDVLSDLEVLILLLEDRRFFRHSGIDFWAIARELFKMSTAQRYGGASTIDMQFVRTRTGFKDRTIRRKVYEMILAYYLQGRMEKWEILRAYLREMYLGVHLRGVERASNELFCKCTELLSRSEAAFLAAMMVYPLPETPSIRWRKMVERRAKYGLRLYEKHGHKYRGRIEGRLG